MTTLLTIVDGVEDAESFPAPMWEMFWPCHRTSPDCPQVSVGRMQTPDVPQFILCPVDVMRVSQARLSITSEP